MTDGEINAVEERASVARAKLENAKLAMSALDNVCLGMPHLQKERIVAPLRLHLEVLLIRALKAEIARDRLPD